MNDFARGPTVHIVDADPASRHHLILLLAAATLPTLDYANAEDLLTQGRLRAFDCVLLDARLPGMGGLELQAALAKRALHPPLVFMSDDSNVEDAVDVMKRGAFDFLLKSTPPAQLIERIRSALLASRDRHRGELARQQFMARLAKVTGREHEVLALALAGLVNKEIADRLGISRRTAEGHRARIMLKTGVDSLLELQHLAQEAGITLTLSGPIPSGRDS